MSVLTYSDQYINGGWVASTNAGKFIDVIDSNTTQVCAKVPDGSAADMISAIAAAKNAFTSWSETPLEDRKAAVARILENWQKKKPQCIDYLQKELGCTKKFA